MTFSSDQFCVFVFGWLPVPKVRQGSRRWVSPMHGWLEICWWFLRRTAATRLKIQWILCESSVVVFVMLKHATRSRLAPEEFEGNSHTCCCSCGISNQRCLFPETDITNLLKPCRHEACFVRIGILKYSCLLFQLLPFSSCTSWNSGRGCTWA